ncbi:MAG: hypothetical protein LBD93_04305 [Treponema sp.]|nr:hypothetical protein [Treponema sp.]
MAGSDCLIPCRSTLTFPHIRIWQSAWGRIFGFHFLENSKYPYMAKSITDFWHRWHISLSTWFRDYVYIPMGGNRISTGRLAFNRTMARGKLYLCGTIFQMEKGSSS